MIQKFRAKGKAMSQKNLQKLPQIFLQKLAQKLSQKQPKTTPTKIFLNIFINAPKNINSKKILQKSLIFALFINTASALESNIIEIMQNLQHDSDLIRKGFFLDKEDIIKEGIQKHKDDFNALQKFNIEVFLDSTTMNYSPIMKSFMSNIVEQRIALENFLAKGYKLRAYEAYQQLNLNCMKCHALSREWK